MDSRECEHLAFAVEREDGTVQAVSFEEWDALLVKRLAEQEAGS